MKSMFKRLLSLSMALLMVFTMLPTAAFADELDTLENDANIEIVSDENEENTPVNNDSETESDEDFVQEDSDSEIVSDNDASETESEEESAQEDSNSEIASDNDASETESDDETSQEENVMLLTEEAAESWYDADATVLYIGTADELAEFAELVNSGNTFAGKTITLTDNINLSSVTNWTPIGNDANPFWGTFDGQNNTIENMTINVDTPNVNQHVGLFGVVRKATVKNLTVKNAKIDVVAAKAYAGAVFGMAHSNSENHTTANLNFEGITVDGCIINAESKSGSAYVGGFAGYCYPANMKGISISSLTLNPKASGTTFVGGMVGYMQGQNISDNGNTRAYYTVDTFNLNNITIKSETNDSLIGGFAGYTYYGYITLKNATINGFKAEANVAKEALIGGLIGLAHRSDNGHTFTNVEITGLDIDVVSDSGVDVILGGMVGYSGSPIAYSNCSVSGTITETTLNTTSSAMVGGFVGGTVSWAQSYTDCVANVNVTGTNIAGGFVGSDGVAATYTDCEAKGTVQGTTVGGFAGNAGNAKYSGCAYTGESDVEFYATAGENVQIVTYVAKVGDDKYTSLQKAVEAAANGGTVVLLADATVGEALTISGDVTISGAYTITWADGYNGTLFNIESGASLNLTSVTIDGEKDFKFYNDTTTVENDQNWYTRFVDVGEEDKAINADVIVNAGNLTLGEGTKIQNVTIASDSGNGKTENAETGYVLKYNDDLAIIKSNGGKVNLNGASITGNAGLILNAINATTEIDATINGNMGCGNKGGIIIANGGTMNVEGEIKNNKAMARSATILGVINGAEVTFNATMENNKHLGVGSNTAGAMVVLEGASQFVMNGGSISNNVGGRAGAIASRWVGGSYGQHDDTSIVLNAGKITGNTASNDSWNGASVFLRSPATIGEGMKVDGDIAVNAAPGELSITGGEFNGSLTVTDGLTAEISGGTFNYDPTEWLADGYIVTAGTDGTYGVGQWDGETISSVYELQAFAAAANAGNTFSGKTITLADDINLEGMTWTPIAKFAGTFEGGNHTISNFHVDATAGHGGFFNVLEWAKVYKLNLADVTATVGAYRFGTLARSINQTCVENVTVKNVTVTTTDSSAFVAGLFCHGTVNSNMEVNNCTVENLTVNAEKGATLIGGITTFVQKNGTEAEGTNIFDRLQVNGFKVTVADIDGVGVGGLVGQTQSVWQNPRFNNCSVTGLDVTASGVVDVGGFMAYPGSWTYAEDCTVIGKIDVKGVTSADSYAGGFFSNYGWGDNVGKGDHKVINCSADVDIITKMANAGGFVGSGINTEGRNKNITFTGCTASGDITCVENGTASIGGFAGYTDRGVFESCTASGTVTNNDTGIAGQFVGELNEAAFNNTYNGSFKDCTYTGASTELKFIGNAANATIITSVAEVNGTKYTSLKEALEACTNGETVKLIADITYGADDVVYAHGGATGFGNYDQYNPSIIYIGGTKGATEAENKPSEVNAVLDLNGHTITNNADAYLFLIMDNAKLTFKDSVGTGKVITRDELPAIWVCGTETLVTIGSGTYQTASATGLIHATHSGDLVIEGGHFSTTATDASLLLMINSQKYNNPNYFLEGIATLTVKGGTFVGFNPEKVGDDYGASSIEDIKFVDGCALGYEAKNNGDGTYGVQPWDNVIENKDDLLMFAAMANAGNNFSGETIELLADINLEGMTWTPIKSFSGNFVGNNKTISNFHIDATASNAGFFNVIASSNGLEDVKVKDLILSDVTATVGACRFGTLANSVQGVVHNVTVKNVTVETTHTSAWVGGMCAFMSWPWMTNCTVENLVVDATAGADLIGGFSCILQKNANHVFDNLDVNGFKVTIHDEDASGCGVGGFVAQTQRGWENPKVINSDITGINVVASGLVDVGGFIAWPGAHTTAENCHTQGTIDVTGVTSSDCFAGGFFGNLGWNCDLGQMGHTVRDCTADVDIITKMADAGGFVGSATNSNDNSMYAEFYNCSAKGDITAIAGGNADVGGFAGDADRGVYEGCSASGTVKNNGTGYAGQFIGAFYDVTPKYDSRYPADTRDYLVDESTAEDCTYTGVSTNLKFIGNEAPDIEVVENIAAIGETQYASLADAIEKAQPNDTIVLIKDIDLADVELQTLGGKYNTYFLVENKTVTIDMADHTISGTYTGDSMLVGVFSTDNNGHLTLTGNGKVDITAANTVYSLIVCYSDGSTITIENGTYKLDKASDSLIYSDSDESITVNGGSFTLDNIGTGSNGSPWIFNASGQNTKNIIVTGGTYNADIFHQYYIFEVKDTTEVADLLGVPAKAAKDNGDGTWTIVDAVALVNEQHKSGKWYTQHTGYATLQAAINAVKDTDSEMDEVVTLLTDGLSVEGVNKPVTIMKNGHTATIKTADGFKVVEDNDKYEVVAGYDPVAQIGEGEDAVQYATLAKAIEDAQPNDTIVLLADITEDVTIDENLTIDGADKNYTGKMTISKSIDLTVQKVNFVEGNIVKGKSTGTNGTYTIKNCNFSSNTDTVYAIDLCGTFSIVIEDCTSSGYIGLLQVPSTNDSVSLKNVTISKAGYAVKVDYSNGVTLENVKISDSIYGFVNSNFGTKTITVKGCNIAADHPLVIWDRDTKEVNTFKFEGTNDFGSNAFYYNKVTEEEMVYTKYVLAEESATLKAVEGIEVMSGIDHYAVVYEEGTYKLDRDPYVARIKDDYFYTLADALEAIKSWETIVLLEDITVTETLVVKDDKTVSIDLNGHTITGSKNVYPVIRVLGGAILAVDSTVEGGSIVNDDYIFVVGASDNSSSGELRINGGTYKGVTTVASVTMGLLTIEGGEFFTEQDDDYSAQYLLNCIDANYKTGEAKIKVYGGTFFGFDPEDNVAEGKNTNFVVEGYASIDNKNGSYTVKTATPVAAIVGTDGNVRVKHYSLTEALSRAKPDETVQLLLEVVNESVVIVPADVTLDLNGMTLNATYLASFGDVIDSTDGTGIVKVASTSVMLQAGNTQLPLYDNVGYRFFGYSVVGKGTKVDTNKVTFGFTISFNTKTAYELLRDQGANTGISISGELGWTDYKDKISVTFSDDHIKKFGAKACEIIGSGKTTTAVFTFGVSGLDKLENVSKLWMNPFATSVTGVQNDGSVVIEYDF